VLMSMRLMRRGSDFSISSSVNIVTGGYSAVTAFSMTRRGEVSPSDIA